MKMDFSAPRKSRLSAPQLQAQLSRLTDRARLRRLKNTFLSTGAWQLVTRVEDTHASASSSSSGEPQKTQRDDMQQDVVAAKVSERKRRGGQEDLAARLGEMTLKRTTWEVTTDLELRIFEFHKRFTGKHEAAAQHTTPTAAATHEESEILKRQQTTTAAANDEAENLGQQRTTTTTVFELFQRGWHHKHVVRKA